MLCRILYAVTHTSNSLPFVHIQHEPFSLSHYLEHLNSLKILLANDWMFEREKNDGKSKRKDTVHRSHTLSVCNVVYDVHALRLMNICRVTLANTCNVRLNLMVVWGGERRTKKRLKKNGKRCNRLPVWMSAQSSFRGFSKRAHHTDVRPAHFVLTSFALVIENTHTHTRIHFFSHSFYLFSSEAGVRVRACAFIFVSLDAFDSK